MLRAALRRFLILLGAAAGVTFLGSVALGLAVGASFSRAVSVGFYIVGCFLLVCGFFVGNRGPVRPRGMGPSLFGARFMRWATPLEREETLNESAVYVVVGILLIVLGVAADSRYRLL
jgi:hypothetical protein